MMIGICPDCGARHRLQTFVGDAEVRKLLAQAMSIDATLSKPLISYLECFAPKGKVLVMARAIELLSSLLPQLNEHIDCWTQALTVVADNAKNGKAKLPLANHHYLIGIMNNLKEEKLAKQEQEQEVKKRQQTNWDEQNAQGFSRGVPAPQAFKDVLAKLPIKKKETNHGDQETQDHR